MFKDSYMSSCALFLLPLPAFAQDTAQITGVVKDPDQAVVAGSPVTLTNQQTKAKTTTAYR